ncbi:MAG: PHP domain-containing protein [Elusimicrobia bacterium]|nr:PHP domain-containing protein [Elusimicrobiota bacterium]
MRIDLHTHSHYSDGTLSPADVVRRAHESGIKLMVLSDHDCVSGYAEAKAEGDRLGLTVLCGVEINTREDDTHVLGYGVRPDSQELQRHLDEFRQRRERRIRGVVERLQAAQLDIRWEDVRSESEKDRGQAVGRPHVADALRRKKIVRTRQEAFQKYLSKGKPGYVEAMGPTAEEAIAAIRAAGGLPVIAHPGSLFDAADFKAWADIGLGGIEVYYPTHTNPTTLELSGIAKATGLVTTGGSDFHGPGTGRDRLAGFEAGPELFAILEPHLVGKA